MGAFSGQLKSNEIFAALYNMIISQQVFADNVADNYGELVDQAKVDGGLYGDTKLYYATDVLASAPWGNDAEATNLLALHRPPRPETQAITLDQFRQISLTVDNYLSKRAWADEGAFSSFNSVLLGWIGDTKRIYDKTTYNSFIGTATAPSTDKYQNISIDIDAGGRTTGENVAEGLANLFTDMMDVTRNYNDYGNLRSYAMKDFKVVWNAKYVNEIKKIDLPSIFHNEGLVDKFAEHVLPKRYFGEAIVDSTTLAKYSASTPAAGKPINSTTGAYTPGTKNANGTIRSLIEKDFNAVSMDNASYDPTLHIFPGDEIPSGKTVKASGGDFGYGEVYFGIETVICKVFVKLPPYMSAFEVGTSFFNPKSLTENHYLTWGRNTLEYLKNYPIVTVKAA